MDIDAIVADAVANAAPANNAQPQADAAKPADEAATEATQETQTEGEGTEAKPDDKPKDEPFPKKAVNALSRRDKTIGRLRAEKEQLIREMDALRTRANPAAGADSGEPQESQFQTYGEYLKAVASYAADKQFNQNQLKSAEQTLTQKDRELEAENAQAIDESAARAKDAFPDFEQVISKNAVDNGKIPLSPAARSALLESDNGAHALYSILKDGALGELNSLSPAKAAMMVARHEDKALSLPKPKTISSAPEPITRATGNGSASKPIERMTAKEVLALARAG